jgi:predicted metal-dependent HD superfamily phosphohydrolase
VRPTTKSSAPSAPKPTSPHCNSHPNWSLRWPGSPGDRNGETRSDADLAILAAPTDRYIAYTAAVRAEYAHVPDEVFAAGRANLLQTLLDAPAIYRTPHSRQHWEPQARSNIRAELTQLRQAGT